MNREKEDEELQKLEREEQLKMETKLMQAQRRREEEEAKEADNREHMLGLLAL